MSSVRTTCSCRGSSSGRGREGLRYAMEEMTEPRIFIFSDVPL